ncbi:MAG: hypothetical protein J6R30_04675 [Bacteroidales bacterium]|nr:hypothetical protein [Bacteroidales bacterium]
MDCRQRHFTSTGGEEVFTKDWFARLFISLQTSTTASILSYAQYSYFIQQMNKEFFKPRVIVIKDNLRRARQIASASAVSSRLQSSWNSASWRRTS